MGPAPAASVKLVDHELVATGALSSTRWSSAVVTACTAPADVSSAVTMESPVAPGKATCVQWPPPSWVAQRSGPKSHPSRAVANRMRLTPPGSLSGEKWTGGAGRADHVAPPSPVRTIAVHEPDEHGACPNTQPSRSEMKVTEMGANPAGGPGAVDGDRDREVLGPAVVDEGAAGAEPVVVPPVPPVPFAGLPPERPPPSPPQPLSSSA